LGVLAGIVGRARDDRGLAGMIAVAGVTVLLVLFASVVALADLVATSTRAATAADQAVLAAAAGAIYGSDEACARARAIAVDNGARVLACHVGAGDAGLLDADVVVGAAATGPLSVMAPALGLDPPLVRARALAGPARSG
jgi:secretion/DNA translocation related TadE-like protein